MKYIAYIREHFNDPRSPVVTMGELERVLGLKGISKGYLKRLINYMIKRKEITRIRKGVYTLHDDIMVTGFAFRPFYYGLENALTIRKLWEQGTNPVILTIENVRDGQRKFRNGNYTVQSINMKMFFGYNFVAYYDFWIPVSDCEKTLIDFLYYRDAVPKEAEENLLRAINRTKLKGYLKPYSDSFKKTVQAYISSAETGRKKK